MRRNTIRRLQASEQLVAERFLKNRLETSLFLLSNMRVAGLIDNGKPFQGTYVARGAEEIDGVVCHAWNGNMLLQDNEAPEELVKEALRASERTLKGLVGPWNQVQRVREKMGLETRPTRVDGKEDLLAIELPSLQVPRQLSQGAVVRVAQPRDAFMLTQWRHDFSVESLGAASGLATLQDASEQVARGLEEGTHFVLEAGGLGRATCSFNARMAECVQIGGVFTVPAFRAQGFGRSVVAGALLHARSEGVPKAVLFMEHANLAALKAYRALGFRRIGDYGLVLFA